MANEIRLIDADALLRNSDVFTVHTKEYGSIEVIPVEQIGDAPTVDAVEVDVVSQMLFDAFGDGCPCNYNGNDEWLPLVCDGNECVKHNDPLYCWKQYIKHYGERKGDVKK